MLYNEKKRIQNDPEGDRNLELRIYLFTSYTDVALTDRATGAYMSCLKTVNFTKINLC